MSFRFEKDLKRYTVLEKLGEGAYGRVFKAADKHTTEKVALKVIKLSLSAEGIPSSTIREICFLRTLQHPGIVNLKDVVLSEKRIVLVFDYMKSDLRNYLDVNPIPQEGIIKKFLVQILRAIHYCHSARIVHRDIKPQNILLDTAGNALIADFGLSRNFQVPFKPYTLSVQTLWYRAPELLSGGKKYNTAIDIWSVGCLFAEMLSGSPRFPGMSEKDTLYMIYQLLVDPSLTEFPLGVDLSFFEMENPQWNKIELADVYPNLGKEGFDLLQKLLCIDPERRISALDALRHVIHM